MSAEVTTPLCKCGHSQSDHSGPKQKGGCIARVQSFGRQSSYCQCERFRPEVAR